MAYKDRRIKYIWQLPTPTRIVDLTDQRKMHFLEYLNDEHPIYPIIIKSAKYHHRPPLVDKNTASERDNPKTLSEGEGERTHVCLSVRADEIIVVMEDRKPGIHIGTLVAYIKNFIESYYASQGITRRRLPYRVDVQIIPKNDFLAEINRLARADLGEIFIEKRVLGSECLDLSDRYELVRDQIGIIVKPIIRHSIADFVRDVFNKFVAESTEISRIRVHGRTAEGVQLTIDSKLLKKNEDVSVRASDETGMIDSSQMLSLLRELARGER
ncbi:MAG: hypothetical protein ACOZHQ_09215 [Thermodesulfobacteriota bacterium]